MKEFVKISDNFQRKAGTLILEKESESVAISEIAESLDISERQVSTYKHRYLNKSESTLPTLGTVLKFSEYFETNLEQLLFGEEINSETDIYKLIVQLGILLKDFDVEVTRDKNRTSITINEETLADIINTMYVAKNALEKRTEANPENEDENNKAYWDKVNGLAMEYQTHNVYENKLYDKFTYNKKIKSYYSEFNTLDENGVINYDKVYQNSIEWDSFSKEQKKIWINMSNKNKLAFSSLTFESKQYVFNNYTDEESLTRNITKCKILHK